MHDHLMNERLSDLHEGLCVRHIANAPLVTCKHTDNFEALFALPEYKDYDQLPIKDGARIVGVVERLHPRTRRGLDDSLLVGADTPLLDFIHTVHEQSYRLVVEGTEMSGIVTWSDLLKLPVVVVAFSLIARLECDMKKRIKEEYKGNDGWLDLLEDKDQKKITRRIRQLAHENLALPKLELADLSDKARVLREILSSGRDFKVELRNLTNLRNSVMHANDIVRSAADLKKLVEQIKTAEAWLKILQDQQSLPAAAGGQRPVRQNAHLNAMSLGILEAVGRRCTRTARPDA